MTCCSGNRQKEVGGFDDLYPSKEIFDEFLSDELPDEDSEIYGGFGGADNAYEREILGVDTRRPILHTTRVPFRYICSIEVNHPDVGDWIPWGTGTLIGPRTVLTAGHVLHDEDDNKIPDARLRVIPGRNGATSPFGRSGVRNSELPVGANIYEPTTQTDYAIIHLDDPLGNTVGDWGRTYRPGPGGSTGTSMLTGPLPLRAGVLKVNISGYPGDLADPGRPASMRRARRRGRLLGCRSSASRRSCAARGFDAPGRSPLCGTYQYRSYNQTVRLHRATGILSYLNDTCGGHSGSPVWVRRHPSKGGRVLVGIHISARSLGGRGNRAVFIDDDVRDFIIAHTI